MSRTQIHPDIAEWVNHRIKQGTSPSSAMTPGRNIQAMATRLGIEPRDLPLDAVAMHCEAGKPLSPATSKTYDGSLRMWRKWRKDGTATRLVRVKDYGDPDVNRWHKRLSVGKSPKTAHSYCGNLSAICKETGKSAYDLEETDLIDHIARADAANLEKKGHILRANSVKAKLTAVALFRKYAKLSDITTELREEFDLADRDETNTAPVPQAVMKVLLDSAYLDTRNGDARISRDGKRARTLMLMGATMGLRIHESSALNRDHLIWEDDKPYIDLSMFKRGRRHKAKRMPASAQVVRDLTDNYRPGERVCPENWTPKRAGDFLEGFSIRHRNRVTSHQFRARFASSLYRATGNDIVAVKNYMRHQKISTTERYIKLDDEDPVHTVAFNLGAEWTHEPPLPVEPPKVTGPRRKDLIPMAMPTLA